jgi:hypothetical protein
MSLYDKLWEQVNFCTMPESQLEKLIEFLGHTELFEKNECVKKIKGDECIEKQWEGYDLECLTVTPKEIVYSEGVGADVVILSADKFVKMRLIFEKEEK